MSLLRRNSPLLVATVIEPFYSTGTLMMELPMDAALTIAGGSRQRSLPPNNLTLQWNGMSPRPAYDDTLPR